MNISMLIKKNCLMNGIEMNELGSATLVLLVYIPKMHRVADDELMVFNYGNMVYEFL